ncbi:MAG: hypothetical protein IPK60_01115 [Sandaracinaceae bacterium]|nr:hypothetical protein [Sandaracinaceae bacterium]
MSKPSIYNARLLTLLVYTAQTGLAVLLAYPLTRRLASSVGDLPQGVNALYTPGGAHLFDVMHENGLAFGVVSLALATLAGFAFVVSPLMQMAWLNALSRKRAVADSVALSIRQLGAAVRVSILLSPLLLLGVLVCSISGVVAGKLLSSTNERTHDIALFCALLPGVLLMLHWSAVHDLARAALAAGHTRARQAVARALRRSLGAFPIYLLVLAAILALTYFGFLFGARLDQPHSGLFVLIVQQLLAFLCVATRGLWLASALRRA